MYEPTEDVVLFITSYMNDMQPDAMLDIARGAGAHAEQAELTAMTSTDMTLRLREGEEWTEFRLPWPSPLRRREDIRVHLLEMQEEARFAAFPGAGSQRPQA